MGGITVRALFANGFEEIVSRVDGAGGFGSATGSDWSLSVDGDTFTSDWNFTNDLRSNLVLLELDGAPGMTVFDRTFDNMFGTPGSARGLDFAETPTVQGTATYSRQVAVVANPPVGDLWHMLTVDFRAIQGMSGDFSFVQDTDNDIRRPPPPGQVPEPSTLALLGAGLALLGTLRRRRR